jgi:alginate O-acetyltransferase complex protein AlgI
LDSAALGIRRFVIGLGKKVLIANTIGVLTTTTQAALISGSERSTLIALLFLLAFSLQIYFDFSGYSDMALGLGQLFGFSFPRNFNYPYTARSVTDFWRRWHMSLGSWFRDYVYIPLGGNRVGVSRHLFNILIVWMLTGFWHGAGWNFICWGLYFALFLAAEKYLILRLFERLPGLIGRLVGHLYLIIVILLSWILFESPDQATSWIILQSLLGLGADGLAGAASLYYLNSYSLLFAMAAIGCTPVLASTVERFARRFEGFRLSPLTILEPLFLLVVLLSVCAFLVDGSFNPFIYFRF